MDIDRIRNIIRHNMDHAGELASCAARLTLEMGMMNGEAFAYSAELNQRMATSINTVVIFLPLKDDEIGALCYFNSVFTYVFVNSAIPRANMNFALAHEIYHIMYSRQTEVSSGMEVYLDSVYQNQPDEMMASAFAGAITMPTERFAMIFKQYKDESDEFSLILRIANYFKVPYMATLIRCYELRLLTDQKLLGDLIQKTKLDIAQGYERLWLDCNLLLPDGTDHFRSLQYLVNREADKQIESGLMTREEYNRIKDNLKRLYQKIKRE